MSIIWTENEYFSSIYFGPKCFLCPRRVFILALNVFHGQGEYLFRTEMFFVVRVNIVFRFRMLFVGLPDIVFAGGIA